MAGIGFRLQALVKQGSVFDAAGAYLSSMIITSGPWLSGVVALVVLGSITSTYLSLSDRTLLFATIVSAYTASILVAGGPQMIVTRYLADRLYVKDISSIAPMCSGIFALVLPFALLALPFVLFAPFDIRYRLLVMTLFLALSMIWLVTAFLSAAQKYLRIVLIFVLCDLPAIGASYLLGLHYGLLGSLGGFAFGQILCLSLLVASVYREFPSAQVVSFAYVWYFKKYWDLLIIGAVYAAGSWLDNMLFWVSSHGQVVNGFYHFFPAYDTAKLLAYLSIIPALVIFMVHVETNFHRHYQSYYQLIQNRGTLDDLVRARRGMQQSAQAGAWTILKAQGLFTIFLCLLAPDLARFAGLPLQWVPLLRTELFASVGQFFVFFTMLLLLYLDRRRAALLVVAIFATCNFFLTLFSLQPGESFFGFGYLAATTIGAVLGWILFNNRLKRLEYLTFVKPL